MGWFGSSAYEKYLAAQNSELEHENKKLNTYIKSLEASCGYYSHKSICSTSNREESLLEELKKQRNELLDAEEAITFLKEENLHFKSELHNLKKKSEKSIPAEINAMEREIKALKEILRFSEEDNAEWNNHKDMFSFMVIKRRCIEEENNDLRAKVKTFTNKIEEEMLKREALEKELHVYKEFFAGNEVKVFLKDKEVKID